MTTYKKEGVIEGSLIIDGDLVLTGDLTVGEEIEVTGSIDCAGYSIKAGNWIKAGGSIEAGSSILAQLWIKCKTTLSAGIYIYAGIKTWLKRYEGDDLIECGELVSGSVEFGKLVEKGLEEDTTEISGKKYLKKDVDERLKELKEIK
jgi:hypothetical protein